MHQLRELTLIACAAAALSGCSSATPAESPAADHHASPSASAGTPSPTPRASAVSGGLSSSEIETTSDGSTPVTISGSVRASDCSPGAHVAVLLTLSVTRNGRALPGDGTVLNLDRCGPFAQNLHPSAGPVRVQAGMVAPDGVSVDLTVASAGHVSHSTVGGGSGNASAISIN